MKTLKRVLFGAVVLFLTSCATPAKFPISSITPAAEITATMKKDKNENFAIVVTAKYLASPNRLTPPKNIYVVWVDTESNGTINIGQLTIQNGQKTQLKTSTPFNVKDIYITAEDYGSITYPAGFEISRTTFSK